MSYNAANSYDDLSAKNKSLATQYANSSSSEKASYKSENDSNASQMESHESSFKMWDMLTLARLGWGTYLLLTDDSESTAVEYQKFSFPIYSETGVSKAQEFLMKMPQFISIILVIILVMFLNTCGQMTTKDEGMGSKSIEEASGATDTTTTTTDTTQHQQFFQLAPSDGATTVVSSISATFSELMDSSTVTNSTFTLVDNSSNAASGTVISTDNSSAKTTTATFTPSNTLSGSTQYITTLIHRHERFEWELT